MLDEDLAFMVGAPGTYDYRPERCSCSIPDAGFPWRRKYQIFCHNPGNPAILIDRRDKPVIRQSGMRPISVHSDMGRLPSVVT